MTFFGYREAEEDEPSTDADEVPICVAVDHESGLTPKPPHGWLLAYHYAGPPPTHHSNELGGWIAMLWMLGDASAKLDGRHFMICREPNGCRAIVVSPQLVRDAEGTALSIACCQESCGYVLEDQEHEAETAMVYRTWRRMPMAERVALALYCNLDVTEALSDGPRKTWETGVSLYELTDAIIQDECFKSFKEHLVPT